MELVGCLGCLMGRVGWLVHLFVWFGVGWVGLIWFGLVWFVWVGLDLVRLVGWVGWLGLACSVGLLAWFLLFAFCVQAPA